MDMEKMNGVAEMHSMMRWWGKESRKQKGILSRIAREGYMTPLEELGETLLTAEVKELAGGRIKTVLAFFSLDPESQANPKVREALDLLGISLDGVTV